jgi:hypothetical protein
MMAGMLSEPLPASVGFVGKVAAVKQRFFAKYFHQFFRVQTHLCGGPRMRARPALFARFFDDAIG